MAVGLVCWRWTRPAPVAAQGAPGEGPVSFRVVFGDRQETAWDYSGSVTLSEGKALH